MSDRTYRLRLDESGNYILNQVLERHFGGKQEALAAEMGCNKSTVSRIFSRGEVSDKNGTLTALVVALKQCGALSSPEEIVELQYEVFEFTITGSVCSAQRPALDGLVVGMSGLATNVECNYHLRRILRLVPAAAATAMTVLVVSAALYTGWVPLIHRRPVESAQCIGAQSWSKDDGMASRSGSSILSEQDATQASFDQIESPGTRTGRFALDAPASATRSVQRNASTAASTKDAVAAPKRRIDGLPELSGEYRGTGVYAPDQVHYKAEVDIQRKGSTYRLQWRSGNNRWSGIGIVDREYLIVAIHGEDNKSAGSISYKVIPVEQGIRLVGRWSYLGDEVISTETMESQRMAPGSGMMSRPRGARP